MKLAMFQMENAGSVQNNLEKSLNAMKSAAENGADLILFPEVQLTELFPQYPGKDVSAYRVSLESDIVKAFCDTCRDYHIMAVPNIYLTENGESYDASILIDQEGTILGIQKMVHIAQAERFYEQDYYAASDTGFQVSAGGKTIVKADDTEKILYADIDLKESAMIRQAKPYVSLRRTELYL